MELIHPWMLSVTPSLQIPVSLDLKAFVSSIMTWNSGSTAFGPGMVPLPVRFPNCAPSYLSESHSGGCVVGLAF